MYIHTSTLRYANRAKNIKNKPRINEDPKDALLREYQEEIKKLRMMLLGQVPSDLEGKCITNYMYVSCIKKIISLDSDQDQLTNNKTSNCKYENTNLLLTINRQRGHM